MTLLQKPTPSVIFKSLLTFFKGQLVFNVLTFIWNYFAGPADKVILFSVISCLAKLVKLTKSEASCFLKPYPGSRWLCSPGKYLTLSTAPAPVGPDKTIKDQAGAYIQIVIPLRKELLHCHKFIHLKGDYLRLLFGHHVNFIKWINQAPFTHYQ
jgi:hypothetical protein